MGLKLEGINHKRHITASMHCGQRRNRGVFPVVQLRKLGVPASQQCGFW